jgi:hypothetical protein
MPLQKNGQWVLNPQSNRKILVGGPSWRRLVRQGLIQVEENEKNARPDVNDVGFVIEKEEPLTATEDTIEDAGEDIKDDLPDPPILERQHRVHI